MSGGSRRLRAAAAVTGLVCLLGACTTGAVLPTPRIPTAAPSSRAATPVPTASTSSAPDCGNPVASYAPVGALPAPGAMPAGSTMARIRARGRIIVGVSADNLLFGFRDPISGNLEGFDIDLVHQMAQAIFGDPNRIEFHVLSFAQRLPALTSGQVDLVADVMTMNCARWATIDFSAEYYHAGQKVLVRKDSDATGIGSMNGRRICTATGSTGSDNIKKYPAVIPVIAANISDCMVLFQQGSIDGIVSDDTVLAGFVAQDPYAKVVGPAFTDEPYGIGIPKADVDLVRFVNGVLDRMRSDGTWKRMYLQWLKPTGAVPNPPVAVYGRTP